MSSLHCANLLYLKAVVSNKAERYVLGLLKLIVCWIDHIVWWLVAMAA